jgi:hypothetical protein
MDVVIDEIASRVNVADGDALLSPALLRKIVDAVMTHVQRHERQRQQADADTRYRRSASDDPNREE